MPRNQITAVNHYDIFPYNHGGTQVIKGLYFALSRYFDVNLVILTTRKKYSPCVSIGEHINIYPVAIPHELNEIRKKELKRYTCMSENSYTDDAPIVAQYYHDNQYLTETIRKIAEHSCAVIAEQVYTWRIIRNACPEKCCFYREQNVEYDYKQDVLGLGWMPDDFLMEIFNIEKEACCESDGVFTISNNDKERLIELYGLNSEQSARITNINAGYDVEEITPIVPSKRQSFSQQYKCTGFFIASANYFTMKAARYCLEIAKSFPFVQIIIAGGVCSLLNEDNIPKNITLKGIISDDEKRTYLEKCDFALNLIENGAGVNVKMFEYFAYGIPVLSTYHGARGIDVTNGVECLLCDPSRDELIPTTKKFLDMTLAEKDAISINAFTLLKNKYNWPQIAVIVAKKISTLSNTDLCCTVDKTIKSDQFDFVAQMNQADSYIPSSKYFIRCAGAFGQQCIKRIQYRKGNLPIAFIDRCASTKKEIDGIPIISPEQYSLESEKGEVIVANAENFEEIAAEIVSMGVPIDKLSIVLDDGFVLSLNGQQKNLPPWIMDVQSLKKNIMDTYMNREGN